MPVEFRAVEKADQLGSITPCRVSFRLDLLFGVCYIRFFVTRELPRWRYCVDLQRFCCDRWLSVISSRYNGMNLSRPEHA